MIACKAMSLVVKTACLVVGPWTESPIGASCCIKVIVEEVVPNIWTVVNVCEPIRTTNIKINGLSGKGQAGFCHVGSVQDPTTPWSVGLVQ